MAKAPSYTKTGTKQAESVTLNKAVFDAEINPELIGLAYRSYLASARSAQPTTLTRGLVRGGGRKPWRQKGTGRARAGSSRIPHWKGGGVVFGPTGTENHEFKLNIKMKRAALRQALSVKAKAGEILILETFASTDGKVKSTLELFGKMKLEGNLLLVVPAKDTNIDRATRNLEGVQTVQASYLNVFDVMNADKVIIDSKALDIIGSWLGEKA